MDTCKGCRVIVYYCDKHMTHLALKEDSTNNGLYEVQDGSG